MNKACLSLILTTFCTMMMAVPAKRGVWKTFKLADGTEVRAELSGDEHVRYWRADDGCTFQCVDDEAQLVAPVVLEHLNKKQTVRRASINHARSQRRRAMQKASSLSGVKRGLVILAQYSDVSFRTGHNKALYENIMNTENYSENGFKGSVRDYFKAQSAGVFDLQFDVVGPVTLSKTQSYYGKNDFDGNDAHPAEMVAEACQLADATVDFSKYDWNGDGEVDQVYVVYSGKGEADGGGSNTIWPHEYQLSAAGSYGDGPGQLKLDGVTVDTYACGSEIDANGSLEGIGTFCHEFSHCLGYPDMYDTKYEGHMGTGSYDLMCLGCYNGNCFVPAGYTAWEKWVAGWITPVELGDEDVEVTDLKAISEGGGAYIMYNPAYDNEYYLIENRQLTHWDASLPGKGLMITHVDYDRTKFESNVVNTIVSYDDVYQEAYDWYIEYYNNGQITKAQLEQYSKEYAELYSNDHQRMCIVRADNSETERSESTDLYPYRTKNSFSNTTTPAASLFHENLDGTMFLNCSIIDINQNSDKTMSFTYKAKAKVEPDPYPVFQGDTLFYETFDKCQGTGGNDGLWAGSIATSTLYADYSGWEFTQGSGANQCARFGTKSVRGVAITPVISSSENATLTFKAAAWNSSTEKTTLYISGVNCTVAPSSVTLKRGEWTEYTAEVLNAEGSQQVIFRGETNMNSRFFLDDVLLMKGSPDGIEEMAADRNAAEKPVVYDMMGRRVEKPVRGLYIVNGRKVIVK